MATPFRAPPEETIDSLRAKLNELEKINNTLRGYLHDVRNIHRKNNYIAAVVSGCAFFLAMMITLWVWLYESRHEYGTTLITCVILSSIAIIISVAAFLIAKYWD